MLCPRTAQSLRAVINLNKIADYVKIKYAHFYSTYRSLQDTLPCKTASKFDE